jgi:hypothetical protein
MHTSCPSFNTPPIYVERQHITHLLTPRSRVLLGNLTVSQLVKKLPAFYGNVIRNARHLTLSFASSFQSMLFPTHFLKIYFNITPPIYACLFQVVFFPQVSCPKPCMQLSFPHTCYMPRPSHSSQFDHPNNI